MITAQVIEEASTSDIFYKDQIGDDHTTEIGDAESDGDDIAPTESMPRTASKEYVYDPNKMTLKFIFANRDGVNVVLECKPSDTVGEVKAALLSLWPQGELLIFLSTACTIVNCNILKLMYNIFERHANMLWRRQN